MRFYKLKLKKGIGTVKIKKLINLRQLIITVEIGCVKYQEAIYGNIPTAIAAIKGYNVLAYGIRMMLEKAHTKF